MPYATKSIPLSCNIAREDIREDIYIYIYIYIEREREREREREK